MKPLSQIAVVDMTVNTPGPFCSSVLASMGARVVKVEPPNGDPLRHNSAMFASLNRAKESVALDLKTTQGREVLGRLASTADIVLEGMRPGVAERLGADHPTLSAENPGLVYCSISGFGQKGPWRDRPGHDINYLALGGYLGLQADVEGRPWPPPILISDLASGLYAAIAVLGAVVGRQASGRGAYIDLSMTDTVVSLLGLELDGKRDGVAPNVTYIPHYGVFPCSDGRWISLGIVHEDYFWRRVCDVAGLEGLSELRFDERVARASELRDALHEALVTKPAAEWERLLTDVDVPTAVVANLDEVLESPQLKAREMFSQSGNVALPFTLGEGGLRPEGEVHDTGADTMPLLDELGYDFAQVNELVESGAFGNGVRSATA